LRVFGENFTAAASLLVILALGAFARAVTAPSFVMLTMTGHEKIGMVSNLVFTLLRVVLAYVLIPRFGLIGAVTAYTVGEAGFRLLLTTEVYLLEGIQPFGKKYGKPVFAGIAAAAVVIAISSFIPSLDAFFRLAAGISGFILVYAVVLYLLKIENEEKIVLKYLYSRTRTLLGAPRAM